MLFLLSMLMVQTMRLNLRHRANNFAQHITAIFVYDQVSPLHGSFNAFPILLRMVAYLLSVNALSWINPIFLPSPDPLHPKLKLFITGHGVSSVIRLNGNPYVLTRTLFVGSNGVPYSCHSAALWPQ